MARTARLTATIVLFLLVDYVLLRLLSSPALSGVWLHPALLIAGTVFIVIIWFPEVLRGFWAVLGLVVGGFFAAQLYALTVLQSLNGALSPEALALYTALTSIPLIIIALIIDFTDPAVLRQLLRRTNTSLRLAALVAGGAAANYVLLTYFNTLIWPNFWPTSALVILTLGFVILLWFPEFGQGVWMLRIVGLLLIFIGQSYLIHSFLVMLDAPSLLSAAHFVAVTAMFIVLVINYINQMRPKNNTQPAPLPAVLPYVAAVVPTYGEPADVLEKTVVSLKKLDYPADRLLVLISDDGQRPEIRALAQTHSVHYNLGPQKDAKAGNLNSALAYLDTVFPQASLILTQDADEVIHPSFLQKVVGYFSDPALAFVQTPKDALTPTRDPFGTRDRMFYDVFQVGRNGAGAAFACGSGVLWRIDAVKSIGGFATWNVVEDLTTSYMLHAAGFRSEYHNERLSVGLAPDDVPGLLKQRGTWAVDTWRLFLFDNPLFKRGLTAAQRLQYLELGLFYVLASFFMPLLMCLPAASLLTGTFMPLSGSALFPWAAISILYYVVLSRGRSLYMLRMWQYWIGLAPTYLKAFWIAVRSYHKKPSYTVTRKTRDNGFYAHLLWAQFLYLFIGAVAIIRGLFWMHDVDLSLRLSNIALLLFFMFMTSAICRAAFYGVALPLPRRAAQPAPFAAEPHEQTHLVR